LDPLGHVTNSMFLVYAEEARSRYLRAAVPSAWSSVVVHNAIDYHQPVFDTDVVEVSSIQVVLRDDGSSTRPWTDAEREALNAAANPVKEQV